MIDDQNESIKYLKTSLHEKIEEVQKLNRELEQAEKEINEDKLINQKLLNKISVSL